MPVLRVLWEVDGTQAMYFLGGKLPPEVGYLDNGVTPEVHSSLLPLMERLTPFASKVNQLCFEYHPKFRATLIIVRVPWDEGALLLPIHLALMPELALLFGVDDVALRPGSVFSTRYPAGDTSASENQAWIAENSINL